MRVINLKLEPLVTGVVMLSPLGVFALSSTYADSKKEPENVEYPVQSTTRLITQPAIAQTSRLPMCLASGKKYGLNHQAGSPAAIDGSETSLAKALSAPTVLSNSD